MKLIDDGGIEHEITCRTQAYGLVKKLLADKRFGPKPGHHIEKTPSGYFRFKVVDHGKVTFGPTRLTRQEAEQDYQQVAAGAAVLPGTPARGSEEWRRKHREGRARAYEAAKAASPDGKVHLAPATCSACQQVGHKASFCPERGWTPKTTARRARRTPSAARGCAFCGGAGHKAARCDQRKQALAERMRGRAA